MTDRHALLIGVPSCDNDLLAPLADVVSSDVARLSEVLHQSGYRVRYCGVGDAAGQEPTGNRIRAAMLTALRDAPAGGVLLLYFSGHGLVVEGQGYLVPQDAYAGASGLDPECLVPLLPRHLEHCAARLVLFIVDACRDDLSGPLVPTPRSGVLPYPADGAFVLLNSCRAGERSLHGPDGSYFTQALAEVLDRRHPARTLDEVHQAVTWHLARKAARMDAMEQTPELVSAQQGGTAAPGSVVICDGDHVSEAWRRAVEQTPLWRRARSSSAARDRIRELLLGVVNECAGRWRECQDYFTARTGLRDPWSAQDYPVRILAAADACLPTDAALTDLEIAALVAVPFLREMALAAGLRLAATVAPADFTRTFCDGPRSDLEITHAMYEHVCRRAEGLARRGRTKSRDALALWLVHRWLMERSSLYDDAAVLSACELVAVGVAASLSTGMTAGELFAYLRALMQIVDADPEDGRLIEHVRRQVFDPRMRAVASLLWLSGVMAADTRRMPTVVVDHVGIVAELQLPVLHAAIVKARWTLDGGEAMLSAVCDHPALFAALSDLAARAAVVRSALGQLDAAPDLMLRLPATVSGRGLRPEVHNGTPVFDASLPRFRLSDEKVRELLMGRQLYGEPDLAIRELYQNALDACRYRDIRRQFRGRSRLELTEWSGTIGFRQGVDAEGREYVECVDNGVGMSRETLMNTFANAGERFVYRPGFRAEQARWQELNPPLRLIPNSQFGIGVFSYFMIADEIQIATRSVSEDDVVAPRGYAVRIASSGSLFQVTGSTELPGGGTRVRLYLTGEDRISVLRTMRRLLWVAEYRVDVAEEGSSQETWPPNELRDTGTTTQSLRHGEDLWWVAGEGGLAADGIRTNEERYGLVVNLRGPHRPQFTVDRKHLRGWDRDWINQQVRESLPALLAWPGLTLSWLWRVSETVPSIAEMVFERLVENDCDLPVEGYWGHATPASAGRVGCLPVDRDLFIGDMISWFDSSNQWIINWRTGVWKGIAALYGVEHVPEVIRLDGFPMVRPLDGAVLAKIYETGKMFRQPAEYGHPSVDNLLRAAAAEDESPAQRLRRLRRYAITGLDVAAGREIPPVHHVFRSEDAPLKENAEDQSLLIAVAAWAPPGRPRRRAVGGWLGQASNSLRAPLIEVVRRAAELVPSDWVPPIGGDLGELRDHVFSSTDLTLFGDGPFGGPPWIGPVLAPTQVMRAAASLGRPVNDVLALYDQFAPLGYEVAGRAAYPPDLTRLEQEALRYIDEFGELFTSLHLLLLAGRVECTVGEVYDGLARLAAAGFLRRPAQTGQMDVKPDDGERMLLNEELHVFHFQSQAQRPVTGWIGVRALARAVDIPSSRGFQDRLTQRRRLLDAVDPRRPVTAAEIVDLTYNLDCDVATAIDLYRKLFPDTADTSLLPEAAFTSQLSCREHGERVALLGPFAYRHTESAVSWALDAGAIVSGAVRAGQPIASYLDRLAPYRALGAPVPALDEEARRAFAERPADRYDRAMLLHVDGEGQESSIKNEITPLRLIQTAGRFGWTLAETHVRMARFVPLGLTLRYQAGACPDRLVSWQDLLLVTEHRDGQEPVVSLPVSDAHVAACVEEIGESHDQVRDRLLQYAELLSASADKERNLA